MSALKAARSVSGPYLHTGPMAAFEKQDFTRIRAISPHRWVVNHTVAPIWTAGAQQPLIS